MLIIFGGLPGTGKSSIACSLARVLRAVYLRIDTIKQALRTCGTLVPDVRTEGYVVAHELAAENLRNGATVIADSVNPLQITRDAWLAVAQKSGVQGVEVEIICSDPNEHRQRIETRPGDIPGLRLPAWQSVQKREYHPWNRPHVVVDTAAKTIEESVAELLARLPARQPVRGLGGA